MGRTRTSTRRHRVGPRRRGRAARARTAADEAATSPRVSSQGTRGRTSTAKGMNLWRGEAPRRSMGRWRASHSSTAGSPIKTIARGARQEESARFARGVDDVDGRCEPEKGDGEKAHHQTPRTDAARRTHDIMAPLTETNGDGEDTGSLRSVTSRTPTPAARRSSPTSASTPPGSRCCFPARTARERPRCSRFSRARRWSVKTTRASSGNLRSTTSA